MPTQCLNECVFDISIKDIPVWTPHVIVRPNGFAVNGHIIPPKPWPPYPNWPGPKHEEEENGEGRSLTQRAAAPARPAPRR